MATSMSKCNEVYTIGKDSNIVTTEDMIELTQEAGGEVVGFNEENRAPDLVGKNTEKPPDAEVQKAKSKFNKIMEDVKRGKTRLWTCHSCDHLNPYDSDQDISHLRKEYARRSSKQIILIPNTEDPEKLFAIGCKFHSGQDVPQDKKEATKWFRKAAEKGHVNAQYCLAVIFDTGDGVSQDHNEALKWYLEAAKQGHASSQCTVGLRYLNGELVQKDIKKGIKWLEKAADQKEKGALFNLGACYYNGIGVRPDEKKGIKLIVEAAEAGHERAIEVVKQLQDNQ